MLHLKFSLNLEDLADELIEAVKGSWGNPFQTPVVIFPDPKLEQWFRLHWVKKCGTLANLNSMMIDKFLLKILCPNDNTKKKLNADLLRNVIWAYLYGNNDVSEEDAKAEKHNYHLLGDEVVRYLETDGKLDEQHLFDLCGKMASLFLEYETSRPTGFIRKGGAGDLAKGILDHWEQGNLRDFFDGGDREKWQRTLYSKVFHQHGDKPSLLTRAFDAMNQRKNENHPQEFNTTYLTIPFLFKDCMDNHDGQFHCEQFMGQDGPLPVFIFGLTGMGQFYRVILQKFAEKHEVYAYIQNPCMEFWEDAGTPCGDIHRKWLSRNGEWQGESGPIPENIRDRLRTHLDESADPEDDDSEQGVDSSSENALLCYWGKSGRDNIKLWCQAADYDFEFAGDADSGEGEAIPTDTLLHKMQNMVASRKNELPSLLDSLPEGESSEPPQDNSFTITAAPTKEREMDALHTQICKLLAEKDNDGNPVNRISDILVFSPCLDDYRTAIYQAFDQSSERDIPFSIVDSPAKSSLTAEALDALFNVQQAGSLNRPAFFSLIRNPVVQNTRRITDDNVSAWETWVRNTSTFRTRTKSDDWGKNLRRILASRFSTHTIDIGDGECLPYADMMSANSTALSRFADGIEELGEWITLAKNEPAVTPAVLDKIVNFLNNWVAMPNPPEGFAGETIVFQNVTAAIENLRIQFDAGAPYISWACISQTLCGAAESSEYSCGNLFVNGITFSKFIPNRIIPVKHLFFIGADSTSFPGSKTQNTLDLRKAVAPWPGDDSPIAKRRYAFLCQLMCTKESFHISYVNQNIVKDEELYPSSVVNDIRNFLKITIKQTFKAIGKDISAMEAKLLAEKLWKQQEIPLDEKRPYSELFTSKEFRNKSVYNKRVAHGDSTSGYGNLPGSIDKCPGRVSLYQLKCFLDDPIEFRVSQMMQMDEDTAHLDDEVFEPIDFDRLEQSSLMKNMVAAAITGNKQDLDALRKNLELGGKIPDGQYGEKLWKVAERRKDALLEQMAEFPDSPASQTENWTYKDKIELPIVQPDGTRWTLLGALDWCNGERNKITSITTSKMRGRAGQKYFKNSKYTGPYVAALALIAQKDSHEAESVDISIYSVKESEPSRAKVRMTPEQARKILSALYDKAFQKKYSKAVPIDMVDETVENFADYTQKLSNAWAYFEKRHLLDKRKDTGFDPQNDFNGESGAWFTEAKKQKDLFRIEIGAPQNTEAKR
ncbi:MAG: exodeoxyribonuclease V subunit gamma [Fibrobacter sp.]|nr:exodeoxyribonuclease V subunit gamma [Fibrobacter sp.]